MLRLRRKRGGPSPAASAGTTEGPGVLIWTPVRGTSMCGPEFRHLSELDLAPRPDLAGVDVGAGFVAQAFVLVRDRHLHALGDRDGDARIPVGVLEGGIQVLAGLEIGRAHV